MTHQRTHATIHPPQSGFLEPGVEREWALTPVLESLSNAPTALTRTLFASPLKPMRFHSRHSTLPKAGRKAFGCFGLAFGSFFLVVGLGLTASIVSRAIHQRSTISWTQTQGEILTIDLHKTDDNRKSSPVTYKYTVDGNVFRSNVVVFVDHQNLDYNDWVGLANGLPENGAVNVFYNPDDPDESVLRTGDAKESWNGFWFACLFGGFAAFWMAGWWGMSNWLPGKIKSCSDSAAK